MSRHPVKKPHFCILAAVSGIWALTAGRADNISPQHIGGNQFLKKPFISIHIDPDDPHFPLQHDSELSDRVSLMQ